MRNKLGKIVLAAGFGLALAFTLSCSSDSDGTKEPTYWYSGYGLTSDSYTYIFNLWKQYENPSYDDVKYVFSEIRRIGTWIESYNGLSEQELKDFLVQHDVSPKDADNMLAILKKRGNYLQAFGSSNYRYSSIMAYVEQE